MDAHAHAVTAHEHSHPTPGLYVRIAVVLFVLTALEVALYELTYGGHAGALGDLHAVFVPVLLALSAAKFSLVAGYYMHLKQDSPLFTGLLVFPLFIASFVIVALLALFTYREAFSKSG
jgi:cytochrome c oxidase subunit 4